MKLRLTHIAKLPLLMGVALFPSGCGPGSDAVSQTGVPLLDSIDPAKELTIRDLSVIEDPRRSLDPCTTSTGPLPPWSFGRIVEKVAQQAGAPDASVFVKDWLDTWTRTQTINGHILDPIPLDAFVTIPWLQASGGQRLDLGRAPFRLLAIVNRIDLTSQDGRGEFRMVYVATASQCEPIRFWVILEFSLPVQTPDDLRAIAARWHALGALPFGEDYNAALAALTEELSSARLNHVNAVEEEATVFDWNWRSFALSGSSLVNVPLFQSPDVLDDGNPALVAWVNQNQASILADRHVVPDALLGGETTNTDWAGTGFADPIEVRHHFALATCNGCHSGETGSSFVHTNLRRRGDPTTLSPYMTGETITDPMGRTRIFSELARRADFLRTLLP